MKKLLLLILLLSSFTAFAWNLKGHVLIAQIAYENLNPHVQAEVEDLAGRVFDQLPRHEQRFMNRQFGDVSDFAKVAALPDGWRSLPLKKIYREFHAPLGEVLAPYRNDATENWHYTNSTYPHKFCHIAKKQNVTWIIPVLEKAFREDNNQNTKAMTLVFLEHFVADAHQPLHTITKVNWFCQGDAGGNAYCLETQKGQCILSLHELWDGGLGYLWHTKNLMRAARDLQREYPEQKYADQLQDLNPHAWVDSEYQYAKFIYSTPEDQLPKAAYYREGRKIVKRQIMLAAYSLAEIITKLYS